MNLKNELNELVADLSLEKDGVDIDNESKALYL